MNANEYVASHSRRDVTRLHELWAAGVTLADIAAEFGVAASTVSKWAQRYKLPRRTCNPAQEPEAPTPSDEAASASGLALAPAVEARARECRERHYAERRAEQEDSVRTKVWRWQGGAA